jgi:hypothetical protein
MKIGTKSVLFGAHCWFIHPWFVALSWWKLYGFPNDVRLWVAFFVHDIGYIGLPNMDGREGEDHVFLGARIMGDLFDENMYRRKFFLGKICDVLYGEKHPKYWYQFTFYHSRFMAKRYQTSFSKLCVADKLAITLEPWWLYLPRVILTGEIKEYRGLANEGKYSSMDLSKDGNRQWFESMKEYLRKWIEDNKNVV